MISKNQFDILIAFQVSALDMIESSQTKPKKQNNLFEVNKRIVEMNWCCYDLNNLIVVNEAQHFIKPNNLNNCDIEKLQFLKINLQKVQQAQEFETVFKLFNELIQKKFLNNNLKVCLVTFGFEILENIIPFEILVQAKMQNIPPYFTTLFEIKTEFLKSCPQAQNLNDLTDILKFLSLNINQVDETQCQTECKSIARIINMLIRGKHIFQQPFDVKGKIQQQIEEQKQKTIQQEYEKVINPNRYADYIDGISPDCYIIDNTEFYCIRILNIDSKIREKFYIEQLFYDVLTIFNPEQNIVFVYDTQGNFQNECLIRLYNKNDFETILNFKNYLFLKKKRLDIVKCSEKSFIKAQSIENLRLTSTSHLNEGNCGIVKLKGLPFSCPDQKIIDFLLDFPVVPNGFFRQISEGRPSGECFIVFPNQKYAQLALSLSGQKIDSRFIEIFISNIFELQSYLQKTHKNTIENLCTDRMPNLDTQQRGRSILMMGADHNLTKGQVLQFFAEQSIDEKDIYILLNESGIVSGNAIVVFKSLKEVEYVLEHKNLKYIGNRYVKLYQYK